MHQYPLPSYDEMMKRKAESDMEAQRSDADSLGAQAYTPGERQAHAEIPERNLSSGGARLGGATEVPEQALVAIYQELNELGARIEGCAVHAHDMATRLIGEQENPAHGNVGRSHAAPDITGIVGAIASRTQELHIRVDALYQQLARFERL